MAPRDGTHEQSSRGSLLNFFHQRDGQHRAVTNTPKLATHSLVLLVIEETAANSEVLSAERRVEELREKDAENRQRRMVIKRSCYLPERKFAQESSNGVGSFDRYRLHSLCTRVPF